MSAIVTLLILTLQSGFLYQALPFNSKDEMGIELRLDGITLAKTSFLPRYSEHGTAAEKPWETVALSFQPHREIVWIRQSGPTVTPIITKPNQEIRAVLRIYSADEANGIAISGSFYAEDRILVTRIHIAHPKKRDTSQIFEGMVILTYPAAKNVSGMPPHSKTEERYLRGTRQTGWDPGVQR